MNENDHPSKNANTGNNKKKNPIDSPSNSESKGTDKTTDDTNKPPTEENASSPKWMGIVRGIYDRIQIIPTLTFCTLMAYIIVNIGQSSQTRKAINRSDTANFYTKQSLDFSREIAQKELRAYIGVFGLKTVKIGRDSILISAKIFNAGNTPAYNILHMEYIHINGEIDPVDIKNLDQQIHRGIGFIGVGNIIENVFPIQLYKIDIETTNNILLGRIPVYITIHIVYFDVFQQRHFTQVCVKSYPVRNVFEINDKYNDAN